MERQHLLGPRPPETSEQRRRRRHGYAILLGTATVLSLPGAIFSQNSYQTQVLLAGAVLFGLMTAYFVFLARLQPLQEQRYRRRMRWARAILFGLLALAFGGGALLDYLTARPDLPGWVAVAGVFALLALDQVRRALATEVQPTQ